jgi:hypothetical protein
MLSSFRGDDKAAARSVVLLDAVVAGVALTALPTIAVLACFSEFVMRLYGPIYAGSGPVLVAMVFVGGVKAFSMIPGASIVSRGAMWSALVMNAAWGGTVLVLASLWAASGAFAFAGAFAVAQGVSTALALVYCGVKKIYPWALVLRISLMTVAVFLFSYGTLLLDRWEWRVVVCAAAVAMGLGWAFMVHRKYRLTRPVPDKSGDRVAG